MAKGKPIVGPLHYGNGKCLLDVDLKAGKNGKVSSKEFREQIKRATGKSFMADADSLPDPALQKQLNKLKNKAVDQLARIPIGEGKLIGTTLELKGFRSRGVAMKIHVLLDGGRSSLPIFIPCDAYEQAIVDFCDSLKQRLLTKYRKGRKEHGGTPAWVDCQAEVNQEVLDIINYFLIDKVNGNAKKA